MPCGKPSWVLSVLQQLGRHGAEVGSETGLEGDDAVEVGFQQAAQRCSLDQISMKNRTVMQQPTA